MADSWEALQLLSDHDFVRALPRELLQILRNGSSAQYLDTLSQLTLNPAYTRLIFTTHEKVFADICARWISNSLQSVNPLAALAAFAKILPLAPHLSVLTKSLLRKSSSEIKEAFSINRLTEVGNEFDGGNQQRDLLTIFRLLSFDRKEFSSLVYPPHILLMLGKSCRSTRYLAIRILVLYLHGTNFALDEMIRKYLGSNGGIDGPWEALTIDYTFLDLWEEKRIKGLSQALNQARDLQRASKNTYSMVNNIGAKDLSPETARIVDVQIPRHGFVSTRQSSLVPTETSKKNLKSLAEAFMRSTNVLLIGLAGAGKTSLVHDLARVLGQDTNMVTLQLNEQTDPKLLVGVHTSDNAANTFKWQPGVLTTAVMEGRWVFIEDIDRAPTEILCILLPLLERGELLIPNWGESIRAAAGFRLIATTRPYVNAKGFSVVSGPNSVGWRHWDAVRILTLPDAEQAEIVKYRHPVLHSYMDRIMDVYVALKDFDDHNHINGASIPHGSFRGYGPRDLFKWCSRLKALLSDVGVRRGDEVMTDVTHDNMFIEAVDCFAASVPQESSRAAITELIARQLQFPQERVEYCLRSRKPERTRTESTVKLGRTSLTYESSNATRPSLHHQITPTFALHPHALRILESMAVAVRMAEPCLLIGETGTGKTALIQQLASELGVKLTVANLSQQSEASDLLGGYKPVNLRRLAIPIQEMFEDLFQKTFSSKRNQRYTETVAKAISKRRWARALTLWQEAIQTIKPTLDLTEIGPNERRTKKRRTESRRLETLKAQWDDFATQLRTFEMHLASGSKGFAFSFEEGNIVKAARKGGWVLLDEINLASMDTLESLAGLLSEDVGGGASILLSETGNTERIHANKDFRIFGAMNPATDVGKRDLPTNLRSRFTEIYVDSAENDHESLLSVIKVYLGAHTHVDTRAASDVADAYLEVKKLLHTNVLVDGSNKKPHFSLRTLTRTLVYATDIAPMYGLRRALYEGFCMGFFAALTADSGKLVMSVINRTVLGTKSSPAFLNPIPRHPEGSQPFVRFQHYWIAQGALDREEQPNYIITPFVEKNLLNLVRATMTRRFPVLLQGPTSSGKTSMIEYLAKISGNRFVRINNHEHTDLQEYLGTYVTGSDGTLQYEEGVLAQALRDGSWIVLDELNLAPSDVLEALNRLLDDNRELLIPETQQIIRPHPNFMLFATQNPPGMYGGRKVLSRAFKNRFVELHFDDIPEEELETILRERCQIAPSFCTRIVSVYKKLVLMRQSGRMFEQKNSFVTLRDLFKWATRTADDREQLAINGFLLLAERVRSPDERRAVREIIEEVMNVSISEARLYGEDKCPGIRDPQKPLTTSIIWTESMRRLYVLVLQAFRHHEPVLLVGETGSGKTTICQVIAEQMHADLHTVNAHQNMETGDLIGSQRPIRNKNALDTQLAYALAQALNVSGGAPLGADDDLPTLLQAYDALKGPQMEKIPVEWQSQVKLSRIRSNALFEWVDGSLVKAMKSGEHFLLDEISLADDSVLERLNSVLEPGRALLLAEKGTDKDSVTAHPGFQFYATMNPGGDYGKKELSPALRNRFTEIWVPNIREEVELLEIVRAKLASPWSPCAEQMVAFARWFVSRYSSMSSTVSVRDLLAWTQFVNESALQDRRATILHGAALVFIDSLGADPTAKLCISAQAVPEERHACLLKLSQIFDHDMVAVYHHQFSLSITDQALVAGPYQISATYRALRDSTYALDAPTTKTNVLKLLRALQLPKPILLEGSPGVGKTTLVMEIAATIGRPISRINLSDQTDLMDLFGSDVPLEGNAAGQFGWRQAPFLRAMTNGEWVLLDEMNLASQSVLEGLNACIDHRGEVYVSELDQKFSKHPNFVLFAAQNPRQQGGGRKGLPASFVNRFTVVYIDEFTLDDQLMICSRAFPTATPETIQSVTRSVAAVRSLMHSGSMTASQGGPFEFNLRDAFRWLHLLTSCDGFLWASHPGDFHNLLFLQRLRTEEDVVPVSECLNRYIDTNPKCNTVFENRTNTSLQVGLGLLASEERYVSCSTRHHNGKYMPLALAESVAHCIRYRWPCLLVGSAGSGKTSIITQLAEFAGAEVIFLPMSPDMDTVDLVGGYEQLDAHRILARLFKQIRKVLKEAVIEHLLAGRVLCKSFDVLEELSRQASPEPSRVLTSLHECMKEVSNTKLHDLLDELQDVIHRASVDARARFEWVDGILTKALQDGSWLVLDNANLCNPSVLDRLNSLLEPNGSLNVNEQRSSDGTPRIIKAHPSFRLFLTMDPQNGELSRAMRNRSVELYFPATTVSNVARVEHPVPSSMFPCFQMFAKLDSASLPIELSTDMACVCFDHLRFSDFPLLHRWYAQVERGLLLVPPHQLRVLPWMIKLYDHMMDSYAVVIDAIKDRYKRILMSLRSNINWIELLDLQLCKYELRLQDLKKAVRPGIKHSTKTIDNRDASAGAQSIWLLEDLLEQSAISLNQLMKKADFGKVRWGWLVSIRDLLSFLDDVTDLCECSELNHGALQVYREIGRSMSISMAEDRLTENIAMTLASGLKKLSDAQPQMYGHSMERLWLCFEAPRARSPCELDVRLRIDALLDRFDALAWTSGASLKELCALRGLISQAKDWRSSNDAELYRSLQDTESALDDMEKHQTVDKDSLYVPYFQSEFEVMRQYRRCAHANSVSQEDNLLELLACWPTRLAKSYERTSKAYRALSSFSECTGIIKDEAKMSGPRGTLALSILRKMNASSEVPLKYQSLLCEEYKILSNRIAAFIDCLQSSCLRHLNGLFGFVFTQVLLAHEDLVEAEALALSIGFLNEFTETQPEDTRPLAKLCSKSNTEPPGSNFGDVLDKYLNPSLTHLHIALGHHAAGRRREAVASSAVAWINFFVGCLILFVPDQVLDPASKPLIERDRHRKRKGELQKKLEALLIYEQASTGGTETIRIQDVRQKMQTLGMEPPVAAIARPTVSNINGLQSVFTNILNIVVEKISHGEAGSLASGDASCGSMFYIMRSNIARLVELLEREFRPYEDITAVVVGLLRGLDAGLALSLVASDYNKAQAAQFSAINDCTPFLGLRPGRSIYRSMTDQEGTDDQSRLIRLQLLGVNNTVSTNSKGEFARTSTQLFHSFYNEWKQRLNDEQKEYTARSSLYRYRGKSGDEDVDAESLNEMFAHRGSPNVQDTTAASLGQDPRSLSQQLACLQRNFFDQKQATPQLILDLMRQASNSIAALPDILSSSDLCLCPTEDLLPALILALADHQRKFDNESSSKSDYNFYTKGNLDEGQKLFIILKQVQSRFSDLSQIWPEHATIGDVIKTCGELLDMPHTSPLAKLLSKAEQLHSFVYEWQVVTSREHSVAALYNQLTDILLSWRRLELSTWARLLDMEDQKCRDDIDAWWFITYEVVVAAPISIIVAREDLHAHVVQLLSVLNEQLVSTSLGHFGLRLQMLSHFVEHVKLISSQLPLMGNVAHALQKFISYYQRFDGLVEKALKEGRRSCEKEMKEILILASWKDANIHALRDSAKRSHHKLFKMVRKYRAILAQSAEQILQQCPDNLDAFPQQKHAIRVLKPPLDPAALRLCKEHLPGWTTKPSRLKNPQFTANNMASLCDLSVWPGEIIAHIYEYGRELAGNIERLKSETPSSSTKENVGLVKHLKTRKHNLLTNTLRDLRRMGLKSNISTRILSQQPSLPVILASCGASGSPEVNHSMCLAEYSLNAVLDRLSQIRDPNYPEDVSQGEIARSVGYFESCLSLLLKQRGVLESGFVELAKISQLTKNMQNLWNPGAYRLERDSEGRKQRRRQISDRTQWIPALLDVGCILIEEQGALGSFDNSAVIAALTSWKQRVGNMLDLEKSLPDLPHGLSSTRHAQVNEQSRQLLEELEIERRVWVEECPKLRFVLQYLEHWTSSNSESENFRNYDGNKDTHTNTGLAKGESSESYTTLASLDEQITSGLDSILISMQRFQAAVVAVPASETEPGWLIRTDQCFAQMITSITSPKITEIFVHAMGQIQHLESVESHDLETAGAAFALALPIVSELQNIQREALSRYAEFHRVLCDLASVLTRSLANLKSRGFCSPARSSASDEDQSGKLEAGTGLGEGEGSKDISGDVQDDEDLSELAQQGKGKEKEDEIEGQDDAVNMDHDELEGEEGAASGTDEQDQSGDEGDGQIDEKVGDVGDLNSKAVDEKLWDADDKSSKEDKEEKEGVQQHGKKSGEDQAPLGDRQSKNSEYDERAETESSLSEDEFSKEDEAVRSAVEKLDPHLRPEQNLDLPEDMDIDARSSASELQGSDLEGSLDDDNEVSGEEAGMRSEDEDSAARGSQEEHSPETARSVQGSEDGDRGSDEGKEVHTTVDNEPDNDGENIDQGLAPAGSGIDDLELYKVAESDAKGGGQDNQQQENSKQSSNAGAEGQEGEARRNPSQNKADSSSKEGDRQQMSGTSESFENGATPSNETSRDQAFKKLGEALDRWHRQQNPIQNTSAEENSPQAGDQEAVGQEYEHLQDDNAAADTQALGAANEEQVQATDQQTLNTEMEAVQNGLVPDEMAPEAKGEPDQAEDKFDNSEALSAEGNQNPASGTSIRAHDTWKSRTSDVGMTDIGEEDEEMPDAESAPVIAAMPQSTPPSTRSVAEARRLWSYYDTATNSLSLVLTEQLRLILAPTQATKMRGDFRTGKRLNIKRIIPYIASNYKRDKIWMRRSVPQKRNYQIMLAVDDSKSMGESGSGQLAFEALALVSKSLNMLEVGEICVVGFGEDVKVAHEFDKPFSSEAGVNIFQQLGFRQTKTNVRKLVAESITLFREARSKSATSSWSSAAGELWQLLLIISDGLCEEHEAIRRLVRQAQEERIMIVFVIVDAVRGESIVDMSQAVFEPDPDNGGNQQLKIKRYLEEFPFMYYVVVRDVKVLPEVLATTLRQWFSEVTGQ